MPGPVLVPDTFWIEEPVFLFYRTHTGNYMHALVDDYLGSPPRFLPASSPLPPRFLPASSPLHAPPCTFTLRMRLR